MELRPVDVAAVQRESRENSARRVRPVPTVPSPCRRTGEPLRGAALRGVRAVATGTPRWVELGEAEVVDRRIAAFRAALRSPTRTDVRERSRDLSRLILDPLEVDANGLARLIVSPDGELNVIPFGALLDAKGRYLVERYEVDDLASGRDLLRLSTRLPSREPPLIVADPTFQTESTRAGRDGARAFEPACTAQEATALQTLLPGARVATKTVATETLVKGVKGPRLFHIATHGFFFDPASLAATPGQSNRPVQPRPLPSNPPAGSHCFARASRSPARMPWRRAKKTTVS